MYAHSSVKVITFTFSFVSRDLADLEVAYSVSQKSDSTPPPAP